MDDSSEDGFNVEQPELPEDHEFDDILQMAASELTDETTDGFLMVPYQNKEDGERVPVLLSCNEELVDNSKQAYELYTSLAGMVPIGLAQNLDNMTLRGAIDAIEYESRTMGGESPADVRHEFGWQVETPTVYRYLEQEYIDKFFEEGIIQLSSFARFGEHDDEMRKDTNEGNNIITARGEEHTMYAVAGFGRDAYVLSGSTIESESLMKDFGVDGYFKITDTRAFGREIAKALEQSDRINRVKQGIEGLCEYRDGNQIQKEIEPRTPEDWQGQSEGDDIPMEEMFKEVQRIAGRDPFFVKDQTYQEQSEYRWLWLIDGEMSNTIQIECPDALEYCQKVTE